MIKLVGAMLIVISGIIACTVIIGIQHKRQMILGALIEDMRRIYSEIHCRLTPVPELLKIARISADESTKEFWSKTEQAVNQAGERSFDAIWHANIGRLHLSKTAEALIGCFPNGFERFDEESVLNNIQNIIEQLTCESDNYRRKTRESRKLIICGCISFSALLAILLF